MNTEKVSEKKVAEIQQGARNAASFEQKLYQTLRAIDADLLPEYMESFGLEAERANVGEKFKQFADTMSEDEFVMAMKQGKLPMADLSAIEIEVIHRAASDDPSNDDAFCA